MENQFNIDYFIKKFTAIPEEDWCINKFIDKKEYLVKKENKFLGIPYTSTEKKVKTTFCAQGHCMGGSQAAEYVISKKQQIGLVEISKSYPEWNALLHIFGFDSKHLFVAHINNGDDPMYQQPTPKQRLLKALYDLKEKELKDKKSIVPAKSIINTEELILN